MDRWFAPSTHSIVGSESTLYGAASEADTMFVSPLRMMTEGAEILSQSSGRTGAHVRTMPFVSNAKQPSGYSVIAAVTGSLVLGSA